MKILHTADWHLGATLADNRRYAEFRQFLNWLVQLIREQHIECLLVSGDIFDNSTPSIHAQELYYRFLADAGDAGCRTCILIGGNHDSPAFLNAPAGLLQRFSIHTVGSLPETMEDALFTLTDPSGKPCAVVCAIPYLRERDLSSVYRESWNPSGNPEQRFSEDSLHFTGSESIADHVQRVRRALHQTIHSIYQGAVQRRNSFPEEFRTVPILGMAHLFVVPGDELDIPQDPAAEPILGTLSAIPAGMIPPFDYLALGHIHQSYAIKGAPFIRYSGSPIPKTFAEANHHKHVILLDTEQQDLHPFPIEVPVFQKMATVSGDWEHIQDQLHKLIQLQESIWISVEYTGYAVMPDLPELTRELVRGTPAEILQCRNMHAMDDLKGPGRNQNIRPEDMTPEKVFCLKLETAEVPAEQRPELSNAFQEILNLVQTPSDAGTVGTEISHPAAPEDRKNNNAKGPVQTSEQKTFQTSPDAEQTTPWPSNPVTADAVSAPSVLQNVPER